MEIKERNYIWQQINKNSGRVRLKYNILIAHSIHSANLIHNLPLSHCLPSYNIIQYSGRHFPTIELAIITQWIQNKNNVVACLQNTARLIKIITSRSLFLPFYNAPIIILTASVPEQLFIFSNQFKMTLL